MMLKDELSDLERIRLEKINRLQAEGIDPFPARSRKDKTTRQAIEAFEALESQTDAMPVKAIVAGRIRAMRPMGKLAFAHIEDLDGRLQLFFRIDELGTERMQDLIQDYDLGDL